MLGLEPKDEEISLEEFISHVHPDDRKKYLKAIDHIYATREPLDMVTRAIRPDGSIRYLHRRAAILTDDAGNAVKGYGTAQDITDRIEAEREKKRLENLMEATELVAGTGSYEVDLRTNKILFSNGLFKLFGYEPGEFEPSEEWIDEHSHPDDISSVRQILIEAINRKSGYTYTRRIFRKDGQIRTVECQGKILLDENGNPLKFIGLLQDITKRKQAENKIIRSEKRSRNLLRVLQNAPDSYLVLTPTFYIEMASDSYLENTNTSRDEIIGKYIFDVFPDNPALPDASGVKNINASLQSVLSTKKPHRMAIQNFDVKRRDAGFEEKYWSLTNSPVLNAEGEVEYIIQRILDISDVVLKKQATVKGLVTEAEMLKTSLEEIKLQADQIQETRSLLQSIFDASPNSIVLFNILYNKEGKADDFQFAMLNAFNFEQLSFPEDLVGKKLSSQFPNVRSTGVLEQLKITAETDIPADFETLYEGDGLNHYFRFRAKKVENRLVLTSEDITERKKSEETIHQMLNGSIAAITLLQSIRNEQGKIIDFEIRGANKAAENINNLTEEQLVGTRLLDLYPGVSKVFLDTYIEVVETGKALRVQKNYTHEQFENWFDVSAVKNGDGIILTYHDITEQKNREKELVELKEELAKKATDKYRKIINSLDEGYCLVEMIYDEQGDCVDYRYVETNPVFEAHSGMSNVLGKTVKELVPNIEPFWLEYYSKVSKTGESLRFDDYSQSLERWFDVYAFRLDSQQEQQVAIIFKDVTERKQAEERQTFLLKLNDALRPLADPTEIQYTAMQVLGAHLEANRAYYAEAMEDQDTLQSRPGYLDGVEPAPPEGKLTDFDKEIRNILLEGRTLVLDDVSEGLDLTGEMQAVIDEAQLRACIGVPLVKNGKLLAVVGVHQAVPRKWTPVEVSLVEEVCEYTWAAVERARAENALRESEQRFRDLVESSAIAVWETNGEGFVVQDSPSWRKFTGQTLEQWLGTGWANAIHPEDREYAEKNWRVAVESQQKIDVEFRLKNGNNKFRWTNVKGTPIFDFEGKVKKWAGMNLDIHDRKLTEEALLKAKEEAEAASRAKEDFVSTMSHEIRTPLNAVIGLTNLLLDSNPREDQKENLSSLSFSAQNLLSLINDILDFSKLEVGKGEVDQNEFDLSKMILSLQQLYKPQARNNGTILKVKIEENIPQYIVTDQLKLSQILHNLVSNAVKFTRNGSIDFGISIGKRENDLLWLDFSIEDTGIGVPEEKLSYIFEKFSQAESSTVRQYGGTGLGLTITKLLLDLLGSEIKVESREGKGSRFYFSLPVKEAKIPALEEEIKVPQEEFSDLSHIKLLLVEDVEINRNILIQFFKNWWNLIPEEAVNGEKAVEMAQQNSYDFILMDVRMPIMDGYEATRLIRKIKGYENTPILALTADKNQEVQQVQHATQFDDLLTKPFDPAKLKKIILYHLNLKRTNGNARPNSINNEINNIPPSTKNLPTEKALKSQHYSVKKYQSLAGENREVFEKLINTSIKAIQLYKQEFSTAAKAGDVEAISNLIHKNTITLHYIEAKVLEKWIPAYRDKLKASETKTMDNQELNDILAEFDVVTSGLEDFISRE
ncbi:PAS domain S-box protein [Antarcticibacterium sp. 1MA-6-2]|nr:PAS domain S-box protein [Antarcticibacterium sp. 1MA-6-2]